MKELLPIGSVVLLKGAKKRLMICGRLQYLEGDSRLYEYSGCLFPEGITDPRQMYVFDGENIDQVLSIGYRDEEEQRFHKLLVEKGEEMGWRLS